MQTLVLSAMLLFCLAVVDHYRPAHAARALLTKETEKPWNRHLTK